ncbi:MAG: hypothetical protein ACTSYU_12170 [Promethearchaeota archaeon]
MSESRSSLGIISGNILGKIYGINNMAMLGHDLEYAEAQVWNSIHILVEKMFNYILFYNLLTDGLAKFDFDINEYVSSNPERFGESMFTQDYNPDYDMKFLPVMRSPNKVLVLGYIARSKKREYSVSFNSEVRTVLQEFGGPDFNIDKIPLGFRSHFEALNSDLFLVERQYQDGKLRSMSNRVFARSATDLFSRFFSDIIEKVSSRFKTGRLRLFADKVAVSKKTVDNWADGMLEFGGIISETLGQAIFFEMAGMDRNDYLRNKPWNLAFNFLYRGIPEITIVPDGKIYTSKITGILKKLRDEGDPRFKKYAQGLSRYIKDLGAPLQDGLPVYRSITVQEYYQAIFSGSGIFMPVMTPAQTKQFAQIIDITAKFQENLVLMRTHSLPEMLAQLCKIPTSATLQALKTELAEARIDLATLQEILAAWGFQYETAFEDSNYLSMLSQSERDCRDYWFTLMESSTSLYVPTPPAAT